jgi:hypothetical protein
VCYKHDNSDTQMKKEDADDGWNVVNLEIIITAARG